MARRAQSEFERVAGEAVAHHRAGRLAAARQAYDQALALAPGHAMILHNLGVVASEQGDQRGAIGHLDAAITAEPGYASAHYHRAAALADIGETAAAIAGFTRACELEPGHYEAHRRLGFLWLAQGERGRSLDHFARTWELRRGEDRSGIAYRSLTWASREKLAHDAAQLRHIAAHRRDGRRFELLARSYDEVAGELAEAGAAELTPCQLERLGEDYNSAINIEAAPELPGGALNAALDAADITRRFRGESPGALCIDDLLSPPALARLRRFLLESTIWHDFGHIGGFVASYLEDGLACPLLLQIADELRQRLDGLLGPHPLTQAWAFKGLRRSAAVEAHADDAAISLNLWLTPDAANLEPASGGLIVCREPAPAGWAIAGYDEDMAGILAFMDRHRDKALAVPYRENRAVLFEARLFHRSDAPRFAAGYEAHRINLTLLFGEPS